MLVEPLAQRVIDARLPSGAARTETGEDIRIKSDCCRYFRRWNFRVAAQDRRFGKSVRPIRRGHIRDGVILISSSQSLTISSLDFYCAEADRERRLELIGVTPSASLTMLGR